MKQKPGVIAPLGDYFRDMFTRDGLRALANLLPIFAVISVYWSLYDQCSSAWVLQAKNMDLHFLGREWEPMAQLQW